MSITRGRALLLAALFSGLVAAMLMLCSPNQAFAAQESEPNNSFAQANSFKVGDVVRGVISEEIPGMQDREYDYFCVYIPQAGEYKLTMANDTYHEYNGNELGYEVHFEPYNQYYENIKRGFPYYWCKPNKTRPITERLVLGSGLHYIKVSTYLNYRDYHHEYHFGIKPVVNKTSITKVTPAKKVATVKFKKKVGSSGYEIRYATNSKMKGAKKIAVKASKSSAKIKKLKKNKKYYFQVRVVKKMEGKNFYSNWSSKKSVKIKR